MHCLDRDRTLKLLQDQLPEERTATFWQHVEGCDACRQLVDQMCSDPELEAARDSQHQATVRLPFEFFSDLEHSPLVSVDAVESSEDLEESGSSVLSDEARPGVGETSRHDALRSLGRFEMKQRLGIGGFGVVYLAYDTVLKREVALKLPRFDSLTDPEMRKQFLHEGKTAAAVHHPNLVPVYEAGEVEGTFYLAAAYTPGPTLAQWMRDRPAVDSATAARVVVQLAEAVQHMHQRGILHRDIKPSNVLLAPVPSGQLPFTPKLTDFGLAKIVDSDATRSLTGIAMGTPRYMAPEQATGQPDAVGPHTDIYALGVVLYELIAGKPPIVGRNPAETFRRIVTQDPTPPRRVESSIARDLEAICLRCLEKDPRRRYRKAGDVARDLKRFLAGEATVARPVLWPSRAIRWMRKRPATAALLAATGIFIGCVMGLQYRNNLLLHDMNRDLKTTAARARKAQQTSEASDLRAQQLLFAADMQLASRAWRDGDLWQFNQLLTRHADDPVQGFEHRCLAARGYMKHERLASYQADVYVVRFSPDQRLVASAGRSATVRIHELDRGTQRSTIETGQSEVNDVCFSPDGTELATAGDDGTICVWDLQTSQRKLRIDAHRGFLVFQVRYTGDGRLISCGSDPVIRLWDAQTGEPRETLQGNEAAVEALSLTSEGHLVAAVGEDRFIRIWNLETHALTWKREVPDRFTTVAFSSDGEYVAAGDAEGTARVYRFAADKQIFESRHLDGIQSLAVAPQGKAVAVGDRSGVVSVWHYSDSGRSPAAPARRWQSHNGRIWSLAFSDAGRLASASSDGNVLLWPSECTSAPSNPLRRLTPVRGVQEVATTSSRLVTAGSEGISLWDAPHNKLLRKLDTSGKLFRRVAISSDERLLAAGTKAGEIALWELRLESDQPIHRWNFGNDLGRLAFSPDRKLLMAVSWEGNSVRVYDVRSREKIFEASVGSPHECLFTPDSRRIVVNDLGQIVSFDVHTGERLWKVPGHGTTNCLAMSPTGETFAAGGRDRKIGIYDVKTGTRLLTMAGHRKEVEAIQFAPDGRSLVSGDEAGALKVWQTATGQELFNLVEHSRQIWDLAFDPDARYLAYRDDRNDVYVFTSNP